MSRFKNLLGKKQQQASVEDEAREVELTEERNAAEGKSRKLTFEVTENPKVNRGHEGQVTSITIKGKAPFKGDVTVKARGDVAAAYWSVTPGMKLSARVFESGDNEYEVDTMDLVPNG